MPLNRLLSEERHVTLESHIPSLALRAITSSQNDPRYTYRGHFSVHLQVMREMQQDSLLFEHRHLNPTLGVIAQGLQSKKNGWGMKRRSAVGLTAFYLRQLQLCISPVDSVHEVHLGRGIEALGCGLGLALARHCGALPRSSLQEAHLP